MLHRQSFHHWCTTETSSYCSDWHQRRISTLLNCRQVFARCQVLLQLSLRLLSERTSPREEHFIRISKIFTVESFSVVVGQLPFSTPDNIIFQISLHTVFIAHILFIQFNNNSSFFLHFDLFLAYWTNIPYCVYSICFLFEFFLR